MKAKFVVLLIVVVFLTGGCWRAPQQGEPGGEAPAVITVWHSLQGAQSDILDKQVEKINAAHPEVIVKLKNIPEKEFVSFTYKAESGGEGPEIFIASRNIIHKLYEQGAIAPVVQFSTEAFPGTTAQFRYGEKLYAQPWLTDVPLLYYRLDKGKPPVSFLEFMRESKDKEALVLTSLNVLTLGQWWSAQGGQLWNNGLPDFNSAANLNFLQQITALRDAKKIEVKPDALNLFVKGEISYTIAWASQAQLLTRLKVPWGSVSLASLTGGQGKQMLGETIGIANSTIKTTEALAPFIQIVEKALLDPAVEGEFVSAGYGVPADSGYYRLPGLQKGIWPQVKGTLAKAWSLEGDAPEWKLVSLLDSAWADAYYDKNKPDEALVKAQSQANKVLKSKP